jgi:O-antigen biosynthesis protein WbqP
MGSARWSIGIYMKTIRALDLILAAGGLLVLSPLLGVLLGLGWLDNRSPLFSQVRLGRNMKPFVLVKFRTMRRDAASVPTHLADPAAITPFGRFLRRSKLDELPQLWNVLVGDMSLVGPRPGLPSQTELTEARCVRGIFGVRPGITGLAQLSGIDMSTPDLLAETDAKMIAGLNFGLYFRFIFMTVAGSGYGDRIKGG